MKVAIVGSRSFVNPDIIKWAITASKFDITCIISGGAKGIDSFAEGYANARDIPTIIFLPDWNLHGKSAGFIRNKQIIDEAEACIAIWDGKSNGTQHTINLAKKKRIPIYIYVPKSTTNI